MQVGTPTVPVHWQYHEFPVHWHQFLHSFPLEPVVSVSYIGNHVCLSTSSHTVKYTTKKIAAWSGINPQHLLFVPTTCSVNEQHKQLLLLFQNCHTNSVATELVGLIWPCNGHTSTLAPQPVCKVPVFSLSLDTTIPALPPRAHSLQK